MKKQKSYREQRFNFVFFTTIGLFVIGQLFLPFLIVFCHMIATVLGDWWFYTLRGVKESSSLPMGFFEERQITRHQVDQYTRFVVNIKRINFVWAMITAVIGITFQMHNLIILAIGIFYGCNILGIGLALLLKYIQYPYRIENFSDNKFSFQNRSNDLFDPMNSTGFMNPGSPNYIHKHWNN